MWGVPLRPSGDQDIDTSPTEGADQAAIIQSASTYPRLRARSGFKLASAVAALLAVTAVVFLVLHCQVRRVRRPKILGIGERRLASGDEEDEAESFVQESLRVCEGIAEADEQQVQQPRMILRPMPKPAPATPADAWGSQPRTRKRHGKTMETLKILLKMAKGSAEISESSYSSDQTSAFLTSSSSVKEPSEFEEEPLTKKKKTEVSTLKETQIGEAETSAPGEASTSRGGLVGEDPSGIPESLLELYLQDPLPDTKEWLIADWLLDPEADLPTIPTLLEEGQPHSPALQMGPETVPSLESLGGSSLMAGQAAVLAGGQEQHAEVAGSSSELVSSSYQPPEVPAFSLPETAPTAPEEPSTSAALTSPTLTQLITRSRPAAQAVEQTHGSGAAASIDEEPSTSAALTSPTLTQLITRSRPAAQAVEQTHGSGAAASIDESSPTATAGPPLDEHPFYRLPASWPRKVRLPGFLYSAYFTSMPLDPLSTTLEKTRRILAKQDLSAEDVRRLQFIGEELLRYAGRYLSKPASLGNDANLLLCLGPRVLLAHYLLIVCEVVGPNMRKEEWWGPLMGPILTPPSGWRPPIPSPLKRKGKGRGAVVQKVISVMGALRRGERLPANLIVPIMQDLLCSRDTQKFFRHSGWRGFRRADQRFLGIDPEESESSDDDQDT
ncbi:hypothetical protein Emed_001537 [Eimeria media]